MSVETQAPTVGDVIDDSLPLLPASDVTRLASVRADGGLLGHVWMSAASRTGRSHFAGRDGMGITGQDAYCFRLSDDGKVVAVAVADGLGSHRDSHRGASAAVMAACEVLTSEAARSLLDGCAGVFAPDADAVALLDIIRGAVADAGAVVGPGAQVATTLVAALIDLAHPERQGVLFRVGDSNAFVLVDDRFVEKTIFPSKSDGPANQVDASLPSAASDRDVEAIRLIRFPKRSILVLASDGVADDIAASPAVRRWFESRWTKWLDATAMADTLAYRRRGSTDDRTALVLHLYGTGDVDEQPSEASDEAPDAAPDDALDAGPAEPVVYAEPSAELAALGEPVPEVGSTAQPVETARPTPIDADARTDSDDGGERDAEPEDPTVQGGPIVSV